MPPMAGLPRSVETALADPAYARANSSVVSAALEALGCTGSKVFRAFYERYAGPFAGIGGYELLDVVDGPENVTTQTEAVRRQYRVPARYLVISTYVANAIIVYDCETDFVFDVDFEGSEQDLLAGVLEPRWRSFEAFLVDFFSE